MPNKLCFPPGLVAPYLLKGNCVKDLALDGGANIRDYPWSYNQWHKKPDPTGPDCPQLADCLVLDGDRPRGETLELTNIAGTALTLKGSFLGRLSEVYVKSAINGVNITTGDGKHDHIDTENIIRDAITVSGAGNVRLEDCHPSGGDRAYVISARIQGAALTADNHRIGFAFSGDAHASTLDEPVIMGCWECGLAIDCNGLSVSKLTGDVPAASPDHANPIGVRIGPSVHQTLTGELNVGEGATGFVMQGGERFKLELDGGGWGPQQKSSVYLKLIGRYRDGDILIRGAGDGGWFLDRSQADIDDSVRIFREWKGTAGEKTK